MSFGVIMAVPVCLDYGAPLRAFVSPGVARVIIPAASASEVTAKISLRIGSFLVNSLENTKA